MSATHVKGTRTQSTVVVALPLDPPVSVTVTPFAESRTALVCVTDCDRIMQWVTYADDTAAVCFGLRNTREPFNTSLARALFARLHCDRLVLGVGMRVTSPERMRAIVAGIFQQTGAEPAAH